MLEVKLGGDKKISISYFGLIAICGCISTVATAIAGGKKKKEN